MIQEKYSFKLMSSFLAIAALISITACGGSSNSLTSDSADDRIAAAKVGLDGEYDPNGLAKRVSVALDTIPDLAQNARVYVAQTGDTVILKGNVLDREILDRIVATVKEVKGVGSIDVDGITIR